MYIIVVKLFQCGGITLLELSTDLSGRYVSFRMNPLTFKDVFKWGGLPQRLLFTNDEDKTNYLSSLYDSIILKDIVERIGIKDIASFNKVLQMMNFKISG